VNGVPTSWFPEEESRQEPAWPPLLAQYYRNTIAEEEELRLRAALEKVVAERRAGRARAAGNDLNLQAENLRNDERALDVEPKNTMAEQIQLARRRQHLLLVKAGVVDHEAEESQKLLQADALRDAEVKAQLKSMEKERRAIEGLEHVKTEMEKRAEQLNEVPGLPARNRFGQRIVYKESCEAENNTVFRNGRCVVGGEEDGPQTPEEIGAFNAKNKVRDELDTLLTRQHQLAEKHDAAKGHVADIKDEVKIFQRRLEHQRKNKHPSEEILEEMHRLEKRLSEAEGDVKLADEELNKKTVALETGQNETNAKKAELHQKLKELKAVQQAIADQDEKDLVNLHKLQDGSHHRLNDDDEKMANTEKNIQTVIGRRETHLANQAQFHKGEDSDDLQKQHDVVAALYRNVGAEAKADEDHNHSEMAKLHTKQSELAKKTDDEMQLAVRDAASRGVGGQLLRDSQLPDVDQDALRQGNKELGKLLNDESKADVEERDAVLQASEVQGHKNSTAMRLENTETELLHTKQSSVSVYLALLSGSCADARRQHKNCLSSFL